MPVNKWGEIRGSGVVERFVRWAIYGQTNSVGANYQVLPNTSGSWTVDSGGSKVAVGIEPSVSRSTEHRHQLPLAIGLLVIATLSCYGLFSLLTPNVDKNSSATPTQTGEVHSAPFFISKPSQTATPIPLQMQVYP